MRKIYVLSNILSKPLANILNISLKNINFKFINTIDVPLSINQLSPNNEFIIISDKLSDKEIQELNNLLNDNKCKLHLYIINVNDNRDLSSLLKYKNVYLIHQKEKQIETLKNIIEKNK